MKTIHQNLPACLDTSGHFFFIILDLDGFIKYLNPLYQEKISYLAPGTTGLSFFMKEISPDATLVQKKFKDFLSGRPGSNLIEQRIMNEDGEFIFIRWELNLVNYEDEDPGTVQCIGVDITDLKNDKSSLQKKADRYQQLYQSSLLPRLIFDAKTFRVLDANPSSLHFFQYNREDLLRCSMKQLLSHECWNRLQSDLLVKSNMESWKMDCLTQLKNGAQVNSQLHLLFSKEENNSFIQVTLVNNPKDLESQANILENVSDIIITTDSREKVKTWNKVAEQFYGITEQDAIGKKISDLVRLEYENTTRDLAIGEMKTKGIWKGEVAFENKSGEKKYLLNSIMLLKNNGYDDPGVLVVGRDITERKIAERNLAASEQFYRNLISNSLDGMLILNEEGIIQFVSPSVENILGFTSEDILYKSGFSYIHPDDIALSIESFNRELVEQPLIKSIVVRLLNKNGGWTWCMLRGHNLVNNPFVKGMVIYFYDDTLRKQAREILKESESRFRNLIADLQIGVMLLNNEKEITLCNKAGLQILGYNDEPSLAGKTTSDLDWDIVDENNVPLPAGRRPSFMAFHTKRVVKDVVMGIKKVNQHSRAWVLVNAVPILNEGGEIIHVITSFSDITERRKLEQKLRKEEINKQKQLTQATIDGQEKERKEIGKELHDNVGQQLTTTKLFLDIAKSHAEDNVLEMINMAIKGVTDAINEVRSISRSLVPPTLGDLGLVDSVKELCQSLKRTQAFQIRFYHNGFDESKLPANQALMFYRIIQEQVNNVIKHSEARAVILKLGTENDHTVLVIVDNGKGFDPANQKKGLGLINMANRAELFNGKLEITSGNNKGCRIRVEIPFNQP